MEEAPKTKPKWGGNPQYLLKDGRPKKMLLAGEILAAQSISKTEAQVAVKLGVCFVTYMKYAKMYGLYGRVLNRACKGVKKPIVNEDSGKYPLNKILEGQFPNYPIHKLKNRMVRSGRIECKCNKCGHNEKRIADNKYPLMMNYIDGNDKNKKRENLELLCYNCYFLYVNNPFGQRKKFKLDGPPILDTPPKNEEQSQ